MFGQNSSLFDIKTKLICLKTETSTYEDSKMAQYVPIGEKLLPKYRFLWVNFFDSFKNIFKNIFRIFAQFFKTLEKLLVLKPDCLVCSMFLNAEIFVYFERLIVVQFGKNP